MRAASSARALAGVLGVCGVTLTLGLSQSGWPARSAALVDPVKALQKGQTEALSRGAGRARAVAAAVVDKCVVITGGPGVGKTTIVKAIVHLAELGRRRVALAAPTGRASKRLAEATAHQAMTIHRLLEYPPPHRGLPRRRDNPPALA